MDGRGRWEGDLDLELVTFCLRKELKWQAATQSETGHRGHKTDKQTEQWKAQDRADGPAITVRDRINRDAIAEPVLFLILVTLTVKPARQGGDDGHRNQEGHHNREDHRNPDHADELTSRARHEGNGRESQRGRQRRGEKRPEQLADRDIN